MRGLGSRGAAARLVLAAVLAGMALVWVTPAPALAATFTVVNADDAGAGSLRQAILDANDNDNAETDVIEFDIDPLATIVLESELPGITEAVTIDGATQPGYSGSPLVVLDGSGAGSSATGLRITASDVTVRGLTVTGFGGTGIVVEGVEFDVADVVIEDNVITDNGTGVFLYRASGTVVTRNRIGVDATGSTAGNAFTGLNTLFAPGTMVDGNVISGNGSHGILMSCDGGEEVIQGNIIGVSPDASTAMPNNGDGIRTGCSTVIGGEGPARNVISGNAENGIRVNNIATIQGNWIGTNAAGDELGNGESGVLLRGGGSTVTENVIAHNALDGVTLHGSQLEEDPGFFSGGVDNSIQRNSIHDNVGLGIDLAGDGKEGATENDPDDSDDGSNHLQNFPEGLAPVIAGGALVVSGTLPSDAGGPFTIDVYANEACDSSGNGEGAIHLGSFDVGGGEFASPDLTEPGPGQRLVTTTATDPDGNTSEFSECLEAQELPELSIDDVSVAEGGTAVLTVSLSEPATGDVTVHYETEPGTAGAGTDYTSASDSVTIPAEISFAQVKASATSTQIEVGTLDDGDLEGDETFTVNLSLTEGPAFLDDFQGQVTILDDDETSTTMEETTTSSSSSSTSSSSSSTSSSSSSTSSSSTSSSSSSSTSSSSSSSSTSSTSTVPGSTTSTSSGTTTTRSSTTTRPGTTTTTSKPKTTTSRPKTTTSRPRPSTTKPKTTMSKAKTSASKAKHETSTTKPPTTSTSTPNLAPAIVTPPPPAPLAPLRLVPAPPGPPAPRAVIARAVPTTRVPPASIPTTSIPTTTSPPTSLFASPPPTEIVPPEPPSSLNLATAGGGRSGPAGVGLRLSGGGYRDCDRVFLFLDSQRIGTTRPDDEGNIRVTGLSVPGSTKQGSHAVTSSCHANGTQVRATASVQVTGGVHRSAFVTALPRPGQVSTDPKDLAVSAGLALGLLALIAFPSEVFNATFEENSREIRALFRRPRRALASAGRVRQGVLYGAFLAIGGLLYAALSPDFGLNLSSLALAAGMAGGLAVVSLGFGVPANVVAYRRYREWGRLAVLPGSILVAVACVGFSRLLHFLPGYLFGLIAGFTFRHDEDEKTEGRLTAAGCLFILLVGVAAWLAMGPVSAAAAKPDAGPLLFAVEAGLAATFLLGLESLLVGLLPLRFLNGSKVVAWSRTAWAALFGVSLFATLHVLFAPGSGYVGSTSKRVTIGVVVLYLGFGLSSFAFWAYFRFRPEHWVPAAARSPEAEFEDIERI